MDISVVVCTYNPKRENFDRVLAALREQSLPLAQWELIVVDNKSTTPLAGLYDLSWHPNGRFVREERPGLSHARIAGVLNSKSDLIVFVDDDNVLNPVYLEASLVFSRTHPAVGCFGGKSIPQFESEPPQWFRETGINLGCQEFGDVLYISNFRATSFKIDSYPEKAPIGTGMVIKVDAFLRYLDEARHNPARLKLGRTGKSLSSGEDNDIILTLVKEGYEIAYVPELVVTHLIPSSRYQKDYLSRMAFESNRTWVKVLNMHGICPWGRIPQWTYFPRAFRSYVAFKAWQSPLSYIRWNSSLGTYKGLAEL